MDEAHLRGEEPSAVSTAEIAARHLSRTQGNHTGTTRQESAGSDGKDGHRGDMTWQKAKSLT